ncbi:calcium/sodium antiporter [candidate division KSB1 bacterium]|nr:calcium/sodium antiporter [candidate division KSB1 bacterium]
MTYVLFFVGFALLIRGGVYLVRGASCLAKRYKVSDIVVGLTVVSMGTSMPELIINVMASFAGSSEIAIGNVFGSNIANVLLILGISAMISNLPIEKNTIVSEIPFSLIATLLVGFLANAALFDRSPGLIISRLDGAFLLLFFALFLLYIFKIAREGNGVEINHSYEHISRCKAILYIVVGIAGLFVGGKWVVDGAVAIANLLGLSESFIGLTIIAIGTSLPELVTSAIAAYKKNAGIAIGNVVGSNIFNLVWVLGISAIIKPLPFDVVSNLDILMIIFSSTLLLFAVAIGRSYMIKRWNGVMFVLFYIGYLIYLVSRG